VAVTDRADAENRLRKIEAITDSTLAHLSADVLLSELLGRTRELLRTDTATMLLLDPSARQLVVVASLGIEEEVYQGVRVPVGQGFAGTIAARRQPIVVDHVDNTTVVNPLLWERGLRILAGVDWYDVFRLPGERIGVVIGDVVGHGLASAVVMGRLRSALRAYALDVEDPAEVLYKLNRKANHFEYGTMATECYAVIDQHHEQVTMALAGHPPPVLAEPGGTGTLMERPVGPPIGFPSSDRLCPSSVLALRPGAVLCFYTDGLVERRDSTIDVGLRRLCATVSAAPPETVCARVMATMVGTQPARDDIAVLVVGRDA
jgi:hypothetical protein